ncbi:hypothetical protein [Streptomyces sp. WM6378]|uniref:hypothetical protein n=1 Tax=Streptomyces sp. WM6378 TaxID=1415557 RepID=UPI0006AF73F9|nr:hypothetical protein [Streptomyces sp. WM6378]KOU38735.1 hypothetical protein ADK54_27705 [Streptomyces sp. WM6378]
MSSRSAPHEPSRRLLNQLDERLQGLIATIYPDERKRPGYAKLAEDIRATTGGSISGTYLWELATGKKRNVTLQQLAVLSEYFGVPPEYFLNDEVAKRVNDQLALAAALRDTRIRNIALRAEGLSAASLDALLAMVNAARQVQNLTDTHDRDGRSGAGG